MRFTPTMEEMHHVGAIGPLIRMMTSHTRLLENTLMIMVSTHQATSSSRLGLFHLSVAVRCPPTNLCHTTVGLHPRTF